MILGGQALADAQVSGAPGAETGRAVGRAASSYLTGLRTYAAAALWNRLDPLMHGYYSGKSIEDQRYMLSTIAVVEWLDPSAVQAYYVGEWILVTNRRVPDGLAMARRGIDANPTSGLLLAGYTQLLSLYGDDQAKTVDAGLRALQDDVVWADDFEKIDGYAAVGAAFAKAGRQDLNATVQQRILDIESHMDPSAAPTDHDHNGDGVPDH